MLLMVDIHLSLGPGALLGVGYASAVTPSSAYLLGGTAWPTAFVHCHWWSGVEELVLAEVTFVGDLCKRTVRCVLEQRKIHEMKEVVFVVALEHVLLISINFILLKVNFLVIVSNWFVFWGFEVMRLKVELTYLGYTSLLTVTLIGEDFFVT